MTDFKSAKYPMETVKKTGVSSKEMIDAWHDLIEEGLETWVRGSSASSSTTSRWRRTTVGR
jgi:hypothetical protein